MKKTYIVCILLSLIFSLPQNSNAQIPQYYNANSGGIGNSLPFGTLALTGYKTQWLIGPNEYIQPTPAPAGLITKFYIWISTSGSGTYSNLTIKMGQTAVTSFPPGTYTGQLDTVMFNASASLTATSSTWRVFVLDRPFNYNPAQSLVIEVSHCGFSGSGFNVWQTAGTTGIMRRNNHTGTTSCVFTYGSQDTRIIQSGIDVVPIGPQYYNYNTVTGTNNFPFNMPTGKMCQWLYAPGDFNQPSNAPSGNITAVYFFMAGTGATNRVFTEFTIRMGRTALTSLPTGSFHTGPMDTVYHRASVSLSSATGAWMLIPLDIPYMYRNDSSLVVEVGQCSYTPVAGAMWIWQTSRTGFRRNYSVGGCPFAWQGQDATQAHFGLYIPVPLGVNNNNNEVPNAYRLDQNYPNPFNPITIISFGLPKSSNVKLVIYDILGREVVVLLNEFIKAGNHSIEFDASNLASGTYLYKLEAGSFMETKKMILVK